MDINGVVSIEVGPDGGAPTNVLVLPAAPDQNITQDLRTTVVQTISGIYTDDFGPGIAQMQLSGTTAFQSPKGQFNGQYVDGETAAKHFYKDILIYFSQQKASGKNVVMNVYDDVFSRAWQVKPIGQIQLTRSNSDPLILHYAQTFLILQDFNAVSFTVGSSDPVQSTWQTSTSVSHTATSNVSSASSDARGVKQTPNMTYIVQTGDTVWTIAEKFLPKQATNTQVANLVDQIAAENHLRNVNLIFPGMKITIPE